MPENGDQIWKKAIHTLFRSMVEFHLPEFYRDIDWSFPYVFLEQELENLFSPEQENKGFVDVLAQVTMRDASQRHILLHVEVQGYGSGENAVKDFEERMFLYYYRIRDKWRKDVVALAILTDANTKYRPDRYEASGYGTSLVYTFSVCKIIDYDENYLESHSNPFATLMLAAKRALKVERSDDEVKKLFKVGFIRLSLRKGYSPEEIEALFYFVDWVVTLSDRNVESEYMEEIRTIAAKEGVKMPYVTTIERVARIEEARKTARKMARKMLQAGEPVEKVLVYTELSPEEIAEIREECR